jgi:hypothetical protein
MPSNGYRDGVDGLDGLLDEPDGLMELPAPLVPAPVVDADGLATH